MFMKRRPRKRPKKNALEWAVTYSDMVTLILVFFILLFSMSQIDRLKFESVTESFQSRGVLDFFPSAVPTSDLLDDMGAGQLEADEAEEGTENTESNLDSVMDQLEKWEEKEDALARLMADVATFLETEQLGDVISANRTEEGVILVMQD